MRDGANHLVFKRLGGGGVQARERGGATCGQQGDVLLPVQHTHTHSVGDTKAQKAAFDRCFAAGVTILYKTVS